MDDTFIGILFCCTTIFFFGGIFGCFAYLRYLRHKEIIALAEKGLAYPRYQGNGKGALRWGIAITGLGVALGIGLYPIGWVATPGIFPLNFGPWMLAGLVPAFFGLALIAIYLVTRGERHVQEQKILDTELSSEIGEDEIALENDEM